MIKTNNKQIHKQTNKQKNKQTVLDPQYLSQINSDLHEIFRETSYGYQKIIQAKNNQPTNQLNKQTKKQINIVLDPKSSAKSIQIFTKLSGKIYVVS